MKTNPIYAIASILVVGISIGAFLAGCAWREESDSPRPVDPNVIRVPMQKYETTGTGPNIYTVCIKGMVLATAFTASKGGGLVQLFNEDGKPMRCNQ